MKSSWSYLWAVDCLTATIEINNSMNPLQVAKRSDNIGEHQQGKLYIGAGIDVHHAALWVWAAASSAGDGCREA